MKGILFTLTAALLAVASLNAQEPTQQATTQTAEQAPVANPTPAVPANQAAVRVPQFGYLSYNEVYKQMPEYKKACDDFAALKAKYDAEATRAEDEFQRKFAEFLNGQKDFPQSIMLKRQAELQDLMEKSVTFRKETQRLLADAEAQLQAPVTERLNQVIYSVAGQLGLIFVLNTDGNAVPFVHPQVGVNITEPVLRALGITAQPANQN